MHPSYTDLHSWHNPSSVKKYPSLQVKHLFPPHVAHPSAVGHSMHSVAGGPAPGFFLRVWPGAHLVQI